MKLLIIGGIAFLAWRAYQRRQSMGVFAPHPAIVPGINAYTDCVTPQRIDQVYASGIAPYQSWYGAYTPSNALYGGTGSY